jgi:hypothetical protein
MQIKIAEALKDLPTIDYRNISELQGELKTLTEDNYSRLRKSIEVFGLIAPLFVWKHAARCYAIDCHQRLRVLKKENAQPYELPYIKIDAESKREAKEKLLVISSQYGTITQRGYNNFVGEMDEMWLKDMVQFDALSFEVPEFAPTTETEQPRLDEKTPTICPKCGHEFTS